MTRMVLLFFNGKWILFTRTFLFGAAHGLKSWVQLESDDLVHFKETGLKVLPDTPFDSHGAYSVSAMHDNKLFLFYTGNAETRTDPSSSPNGFLLTRMEILEKIDQSSLINQRMLPIISATQ